MLLSSPLGQHRLNENLITLDKQCKGELALRLCHKEVALDHFCVEDFSSKSSAALQYKSNFKCRMMHPRSRNAFGHSKSMLIQLKKNSIYGLDLCTRTSKTWLPCLRHSIFHWRVKNASRSCYVSSAWKWRKWRQMKLGRLALVRNFWFFFSSIET